MDSSLAPCAVVCSGRVRQQPSTQPAIGRPVPHRDVDNYLRDPPIYFIPMLPRTFLGPPRIGFGLGRPKSNYVNSPCKPLARPRNVKKINEIIFCLSNRGPREYCSDWVQLPTCCACYCCQHVADVTAANMLLLLQPTCCWFYCFRHVDVATNANLLLLLLLPTCCCCYCY